MTVDVKDAAYCLVKSGRTETAIFSPHKVIGKKYKVDVQNSVAPCDTLVVEGWTCRDEDEDGAWWFCFDDGDLGTIVELPLRVAEHQMLTAS